MREEDTARRWLVVVELREKRAEHLTRLERAVGAWKIGAVPPVLAGAEEEHLDAGISGLLMHGEDVRLFDTARIDALARLDRRERREPVAIDRGALEVERRRRLLHFAGELVLHGAALAGEERLRLAHQLRVVGMRDLAGARRRAALDLMQQA